MPSMSGGKVVITLLYGENDFALKQYLRKIVAGFENKTAIEKLDGDQVDLNDLPSLLSGATLFSNKRLIIIYDVSANKNLWAKLADYSEQVRQPADGDTHLILVETAPDKRTRTFKLLQKNADVREFKNINEAEAITWLIGESKKLDMQLDRNLAEKIVARSGVDQWKLHFGLQKLTYVNEINFETIEQQIETSPQANVFELIDASLSHSPDRVRKLVEIAASQEDPYFFFGLLSSQLFQLVTLALSDKSPSEVATDLGVHPYPLQKLSGLAKKLSTSEAKRIANILGECDDALKRSGAEPWLVLEQALMKLALR